MLYLFYQHEDAAGEGVRGVLEEASSREVADQRFNDLIGRRDVLRVHLIVGTTITSYDQCAHTILLPAGYELHDRPQALTTDELQASAIEGVDDLDNKEKV